MTYDAIIAGAGIWGCTVARRLAEAGKRVLVLEKREVIGGNCRCEMVDGIEVHTYGSHIFHTSNEEVWKFVNRFVHFNDYRHCVLAKTRAESASVFDRRLMAVRKIDEWLDGVDETAFELALVQLVDSKVAAGEYRFRRAEDRLLAIDGALRFFHEFSHKIIPLSDGRYVYFAPDMRAKKRNLNNAVSWAEYAFHAVSSSGKLLDGKNFRERLYNSTKAADLECLERIIRDEHCMYRLIDACPENDAVIFVGCDAENGRLEIVTRLDQFGNAEANLGEVTVIAKHKRKESPPPKFRPLTEVVETVAKHQAAGFSPSTTSDSIAHQSDTRKGGKEGRLYHLPIGKTLVREFFGVDLGERSLREFMERTATTVDLDLSPRPSFLARTYGDEIFDAFIRGYTSKQWGVPPEKVDPSIIARLKVRDNYSTDYFDDPYQGIPVEGYNELFRRMLEHPNITVKTNSSLILQSEVEEFNRRSQELKLKRGGLQLIVGGRLGQFKYYDMDKSIETALQVEI